MDTQGLSPQTASRIRNGVKNGVESEMENAGRIRTGIKRSKSARDVNIGANLVQLEKPSAIDRKIGRLEKVNRTTGKLWNLDLAAFIGGFLVTKLAGWRRTKFSTILHGAFVAPVNALRKTKLRDIFKLPSNYVRDIQEHAEKVKGGAAKDYAPHLKDVADGLETKAQNLSESVAEKMPSAFGSVRDSVEGGIDRLAKTSGGAAIESSLQNAAGKGASYFEKRHAKRTVQAFEALTQEKPSWLRRILGAKTTEVAVAPELEAVFGHLNDAKSAATAAERTVHLKSASEAIKGLDEGVLDAVKSRASKVLGAIEKSAVNGSITEKLYHAEGKTLSGITKSLAKAASEVPIFGAVIGLGVAAGIGATVLTTRKTSHEAKEAHNAIAADIGKDHPLMKNISKAYHQQKRSGVINAGLSVVGESANVGFAMSQHAGGGGMMAMAMAPMLGTLFVQDNAVLNAYTALKQSDAGKVALGDEQKTEYTKMLVATVPAVAANGGIYNRLTTPVAEAIVAKHLDASGTMRLLANDKEFTALAASVLQEQNAAAAKTAAPAAATSAVANDNQAPAAAATMGHNEQKAADAPHLQAGKPTMVLSDVSHEGVVEQRHQERVNG